MAQEFKLPDVGEGLTEAEIVSWKVKPGDTVAVNDIIVEIETAKSLVELPSPYDGTVAQLLVAEGETVEVGAPIIAVATGDDDETLPAGAQAGEGDPYIHLAEKQKSDEIDMSNPAASGGSEKQMLVGSGPKDAATKRRARRSATPAAASAATAQADVQQAFSTAPAAAPEVPAEEAEPSLPAAPPTSAPTGPHLRALAKPPVRKLAKDLGIDLTAVSPSGDGGVVTRADVEAHGAGGSTPEAPRPGGEGDV
ncbi:MAG: E3 binding domain-containing protein, partial [Actinomycetia bacterium]|nr:E3 binding domain-containing protein [Actinomycetes bacterium]